jgi:glyoxylase-like metal-dependent hydrolase (beta-lactamase superfamily II)
MGYTETSTSTVLAENEYGSNLACIALEDELVFVDAGLLTPYTAEFRERMEERFDREASTLIITHAHLDHIFGMDAFRDCEIIAARAGRPRFERFLSTEYDEEFISNRERVFPFFREAAETATLRPPDRWVEGETPLCEGELEMKVIGGHSDCSSSIHFPRERVLAVGDLLQVDRYPYFGEPDTDLGRWINALRSWEGMELDALLPGHGRPVGRRYLEGVAGFFEEMVEVVAELKAEGVAAEEVAGHPRIPSGYWPVDAVKKPAYDFSIVSLYRRL